MPRRKLAISILIILLLPLLLFAGGQKDSGGIILYAATPSDIMAPGYEYAVKPFLAENPHVKLVWVPVNIQDASTIGMDSRIASGLPVNFYTDYMARVSKFAIPKTQANQSVWALDLTRYIGDISKFMPAMVDPLYKNGALYALPVTMQIVGQRLNLTLMSKAGYKPPAVSSWTLREFMTAGEKVKAAKLDDCYATLMFAENRSGDWMYMGWLASFGAQLFNGADYSKTIINSPEGLRLFEFWKSLQGLGFIPYDAAMMNDDHAIEYRLAGKLAAMGDRASDINHPEFQQALIKQGLIKEPYLTAWYPYPRGDGLKKAPMVTSYELAMAFDVGKEAENAMAARLVNHFTNETAQKYLCNLGGAFPTRLTVPDVDAEHWKQAKAILLENGILDVGGNLSCYNEIRGAMFPQLQKLYTGKASAIAALRAYEEELNRILRENK